MEAAYESAQKGRFAYLDLADLADLDGAESFWTFLDFKGESVTDLKIVKLYVHELVGVEEQVLRFSVALDEPKALVCKTGNCSLLHML